MPPTGCGPLGDDDDRREVAGEAPPDQLADPLDVELRSGIRITLAPPARPAWKAIQPAWRPITSTISTRWWLSAVVCSRSIASIAMLTAVSKPKV